MKFGNMKSTAAPTAAMTTSENDAPDQLEDDRIILTDSDADQNRKQLFAAIDRLAQLHDRNVSPALIEEAYRVGETDSGLRQATRAIESAGFSVGVGPIRLSSLDATLLPAIVFTNSGPVVLEAKRRGKWRVWDPRLGETASLVTEADLMRSYRGDALLMRPSEEAEGIEAEGHWFWSALARNRWSYVQVALAAAVANVLGLTTSIFIMVVYDRILPNEATESLVALTIGVAIALVFDFLIKMLRAGFIDRAGHRADLQIGRTIFERILAVRLAERKGSTGAIASNLREFETLRDFFTSASLVAIVDLPFIFLFIWVIHVIGGPLALVPLLAVPIVFAVGLAVQPFLTRSAKASFEDGQSKQSVLIEALTGLETIKAARAEAQMKSRWDRALDAQARHGVSARAVSQLALNATTFTQQSAQILIVFYGVFLIADGVVSMGALIAAVILTGRALTPLAQLAQTLVRTTQARTAYRSIDELMRSASERPAGQRFMARKRLKGEVSFRDVVFSYPDATQPALDSASFDIAAGERVAILGPIGSGKSTIARLLLGLYQPDRGSVSIDGTDIRQIDPGDVRRNCGTLLQDVWLFSGSLRENITIGQPQANDAEVLDAGELAGVSDFAMKHAHGYDLTVAERGEGLSGGQRQAIGLARALLGSPPILLLDEPTSAMDVASEAALIARLKPAIRGKTVLMVTHRKSLLELVDRVIVVQSGKVVADGPKATVLGGPA